MITGWSNLRKMFELCESLADEDTDDNSKECIDHKEEKEMIGHSAGNFDKTVS